ncbi:MBL fold metallo-hydrolase [Phenylobacterium sp.]|uniref:MBL fold metallo-hydrolase n=1 Tax=Phenylobacterium sp. TaxID=1871053 RepID=UPI0035AE8170
MAKPPKTRVTVRMYRNLLGDCFLVRIAAKEAVSHILIDCGILQNVEGDKALMQAVAADVAKTVKNRLDLLVVTHEHHDHISGFAHARDVFFDPAFKIDNLWMAWTENEEDPQAKALNARFDRTKQALAFALDRGQALAAAGTPGVHDVLSGLENFIGPLAAAGSDLALDPAGGRMTGKVVMRRLKEKTRQDGGTVSFLEPGQVLTTPGAAGLTAYVLGPPRKEARLFQDLPSDGDHGKETYLDRFGAADQLLSAQDGAWEDGVPERPFAPRHGFTPDQVNGAEPLPIKDAEALKEAHIQTAWLRDNYYRAPDWRRIDGEWLGVAGALAMKLDSDTNNTSLVLALEAPNGEVLLFAADAQVGNWLSWHDQSYGPEQRPAADILRQVVLYKVGHHASHNATLRDQGLELMSDADLTAMIPVVETIARAQGSKGWNMPYPPLLERLITLTAGRVLRGDAPTDESKFKHGRVRTHPDGLYVEYDAVI